MRRMRMLAPPAFRVLFPLESTPVPDGTGVPCHAANVKGTDFVFTRYAP